MDRRLNQPTFDEWLEDVRAEANRRGDHTRQRHVERVKRLQEIEKEYLIMAAPADYYGRECRPDLDGGVR